MSDTAVDIFSDFATDTNAETKGVWEPYRGNVEFLIARAFNPDFNRTIQRLVKPHKRLLDQGGEAANAKSEQLMVQTQARTILLGWKGDLNVQGQPLGEYTVEKAEKLLSIKDFRAWVTGVSEDMNRFKVEADTAEAGK